MTGRDRSRHALPRTAHALGLAGLLPFGFGAVMVWCPVETMSDAGTRLLGAYGAVILSFLGGVRWGRLLAEPGDGKTHGWGFTLSILPSLIGWSALLLPAAAMFALLAIGLVLQYLLDRDATENGLLPAWYGRLRLTLTLGAVSATVSGLLARLIIA